MNYGAAGTRAAERPAVDEGLRSYMLRVYNYMGSGLALSGIAALLTLNTGFINALYGPAGVTGLGMVVMWSPLALLLVMSFGFNRLSPVALQALYWTFCAVDGASLSYIFLLYTSESIVRVFFIAAATFGAMSLWGYTTKRDLTGMGSFLFMGLIGILIAMVVNIFVQSAAMGFVISAIAILVFVGLTAFETQRIKSDFVEYRMQGGLATKTAVMGAVGLYILFINIFQFLLMFLGNRE
jgi:hypothetical protein